MAEAPKAENIRVICRVRPLNPNEIERGSSFSVDVLSEKQISVPGVSYVIFQNVVFSFLMGRSDVIIQ